MVEKIEEEGDDACIPSSLIKKIKIFVHLSCKRPPTFKLKLGNMVSPKFKRKLAQ